MKFERFESRADALSAEKVAIEREMPMWNKTHNRLGKRGKSIAPDDRLCGPEILLEAIMGATRNMGLAETRAAILLALDAPDLT